MTDSDAAPEGWPALPLDEWIATRDTLHLWTQIVGKLRLALTPRTNHWWNVTLHLSARGLTTGLMPTAAGGLEASFDLVAHQLNISTTDGRTRRLQLEPRSVADFYADVMGTVREFGVDVAIVARPVELADATPFDEDHHHASYDHTYVERFWRSLIDAHRVMSAFRSRFAGKASPVHFFWGAFDLATTRFSGRPAPRHPGGIPNCPDWVMHEAYSDELSSCGYWPGGASEGTFYSYAYPKPSRFETAAVTPKDAYWDDSLGEFILPYAAVRTSNSPDDALTDFFESTFQAATRLGSWPDADRSGVH